MSEQQRPHPRKVLDRAFELQTEREREREAEARDEAWKKAAGEMGVEHDLYDAARRDVARREAAEHARRAERRRTFGAVAAGLALAGGLAAGLWALWPEPTPPWTDDLSGGASHWALDVSGGTQARVDWAGDRATVTVDHVQPGADGRWVVNLDRQLPAPDLSDFQQVQFRVQGEGLGQVRVYLERPDERWRSPAIPVTSAWTDQTVPFSSFERQVREGGAWKVVGWQHPGQVPGLSFKLGHYINPPEQTGSVQLDDVELR